MGKLYLSLKAGLQLVTLASLIALIILAIAYLPLAARGVSSAPPTGDFHPTDFITIILAAVAVILTALAIILAVAGVVGYAQIKDQALNTARETAISVATKVSEDVATKRVDEILPRQVLVFMQQQDAVSGEADEIAKAQSRPQKEGG